MPTQFIARTILMIVPAIAIATMIVPAQSAVAYAVAAPNTAATIALVPDEASSTFRPLPQPPTISAGVVKIIVLVPPSAARRHGVGIDGGDYDDVEGAAVAPGRSTALTISLAPGDYSAYDSCGDNRRLGFAIPLTVVAQRPLILRPGRRCKRLASFYLSDIRIRRTTCATAQRVSDSVFDAWERTDYTATSVRANGFACSIKTDGPAGLQVTCKRGRKEVRLTS